MYQRGTRDGKGTGEIEMTEQQKTALAKAPERARTNGLEIMGHGTMKLDGARFLAVNSASRPNVWHVVVIREGRLECDCEASKYGRICQHRALAHEVLKAERDAVIASERWALTEKGKVALAEHRAQAERREQSMLRQRPAFSLLK
jgi:hypothetical protein